MLTIVLDKYVKKLYFQLLNDFIILTDFRSVWNRIIDRSIDRSEIGPKLGKKMSILDRFEIGSAIFDRSTIDLRLTLYFRSIPNRSEIEEKKTDNLRSIWDWRKKKKQSQIDLGLAFFFLPIDNRSDRCRALERTSNEEERREKTNPFSIQLIKARPHTKRISLINQF